MTREIKNRVTILHTQGDGISALNINGYKGISAFGDKFRVDIGIGHSEKYLVGIFDTISDAAQARMIAERKRKNGNLKEWIASRPHGNSKEYIEFWQTEFERMKEYENRRRNY